MGPHSPGAATLSGLVFGMDFETAWDAKPSLRGAMRVELDADEFDALVRRRPELAPDHGSSGGNRWNRWRWRDGRWPAVDGPQWELRFELGRGLSMITAHYPNEEALRSAVAAWGPPDIHARWEVWTDEHTHTQAAFTGCEHESYVDDQPIGDLHCKLRWLPMQSAREALQTVFPQGRTFLGARRTQLSLGAGISFGDYTRFYLWPLPGELWMNLEVQFDDTGRVNAYRTALPHIYDPAARDGNVRALGEVLPLSDAGTECSTTLHGGHRVQLCQRGSQLELTVGDWRN